MQTRMIQYTTKSEAVNENRRLVTNVFAELTATSPEGLRYAVFLLDDGVTFVHVVASDEGDDPPALLPAFQNFQRHISERWAAPPSIRQVTLLGSYQSL